MEDAELGVSCRGAASSGRGLRLVRRLSLSGAERPFGSITDVAGDLSSRDVILASVVVRVEMFRSACFIPARLACRRGCESMKDPDGLPLATKPSALMRLRRERCTRFSPGPAATAPRHGRHIGLHAVEW